MSGDSSNPNSRLGRKRRGEEQLLLDDHLLPAELRRLGKIQGDRDRRLSRTAASDAFKRGTDEHAEVAEEAVVEDEDGEDEPEPPAEAEDAGADDFSSDDEEVTRCVCQRERESFLPYYKSCELTRLQPTTGL